LLEVTGFLSEFIDRIFSQIKHQEMTSRDMWFAIFALMLVSIISSMSYQWFQKLYCTKEKEERLKKWQNIVLIIALFNLIFLLYLYLEGFESWWMIAALLPLVICSSIQTYYSVGCASLLTPILATVLEIVCAFLVIYHQLTKGETIYEPKFVKNKSNTVDPYKQKFKRLGGDTLSFAEPNYNSSDYEIIKRGFKTDGVNTIKDDTSGFTLTCFVSFAVSFHYCLKILIHC